MIELIKNPSIDFIGKRKIAYFITAALLVAAGYSVFLMFTGKADLGLDFTGGSSVQVMAGKEMKVGDVRQAMADAGFKKVTIQQIGSENSREFLIRIGITDADAGQASSKVTAALEKFTGAPVEVLGTSEIGPMVSSQLTEKAMFAIFWAVIGILVYIWIRFQFKFAVTATFATFHDAFVVLGIMVILGREIDLLVITGLLNIAGYSLTDTVVVFDRIRENMRKILKMPFEKIVNDSINEVLSRSIITSLTTLFVIAALYFLGGSVLNNFALTLMIGIFVGTYSSIFVASPLIVEWENFEKKNKAAVK